MFVPCSAHDMCPFDVDHSHFPSVFLSVLVMEKRWGCHVQWFSRLCIQAYRRISGFLDLPSEGFSASTVFLTAPNIAPPWAFSIGKLPPLPIHLV
jgi:hypothetical protein